MSAARRALLAALAAAAAATVAATASAAAVAGTGSVIAGDSPLASWAGRTQRPLSLRGGVAFDWEGVSCSVAVAAGATAVGAMLALRPADAVRLHVFVDGADAGAQIVRGRADGAPVAVALAAGLSPAAPHNVTLVNAVEPMHIYGGGGGGGGGARVPPAVLSFSTDGAFVAPAPQPSRTLLFVGDSITAGSGDVGAPPCNGSIDTSDVTAAYGFLLARALRAQLLGNIAVSGIGVYANCCDSGPTMAEIELSQLGGALRADADHNDPTRPQAVVIALGTNDFYRRNASNETFVAAFVAAYSDFVVDLAVNRLSNGSEAIFLAVGPITDVYGAAVRRVVAATAAMGLPVQYLDFMGAALDGCGSHPGRLGHQQMAAAAAPIIAAALGWHDGGGGAEGEEEEEEEEEGRGAVAAESPSSPSMASALAEAGAAGGELAIAGGGANAARGAGALGGGGVTAAAAAAARAELLLAHARALSTERVRVLDAAAAAAARRRALLRAAGAAPPDVNVTVRSDGSGDFVSVQAALDSINASGVGHVTLHLLGRFRERVQVVAAFAGGVTLVGDGAAADDALITFNRTGSAFSTWHSETVRVEAADVTLVNVAVANDADGYDSGLAGQSVALHIAVTADRFACLGCALYGAQDTLYTGGAGFGLRSYFGAGALINGSCDSIFGGSSSVFEDVSLAMASTATAPRGEPASAYLFLRPAVSGLAGGRGGDTFLGRPWGQLSAAVFVDARLDAAVQAPGWQDFGHDCAATSWCAPVLFAEFNSSGAGADPSGRVLWSRQLNATEAAAWTRDRVLRGWQPPDAARRG